MKRRRFLQQFMWLTGSGLVAGCAKPLAGAGKSAAAGDRLSGKVTAAGQPLANVIVSDGYSVVATDSKGQYALPVNKLARFVFVSTPAGHAFAHENRIVKQYRVIKDLQNKAAVDFQLEPLHQADDHHKFLIWADPQVKNEKDVAKMMTQSVPDVQQLVAQLGAGTLLHGICVGDMVWDAHELFPAYHKAIKDCDVSFFQAIGNHDMDYNQGGDEASDDTFESLFGPTYYSFNRGKAHYVVLDDVYYLGKDRDYKGYINENQLEWLKKDLAFVPKDALLIVSLHIPVYHSVENKQALYDILAPFKQVHIMSGHTHWNSNNIKDNIYEHVHGTVCGAWWTGPVCEDGCPDGYAVYDVKGTELQWYYKSTGHPKEHQLSLYVKKAAGGDQLVANVWNWDKEWKVNWSIDGKDQGALQPHPGNDPLAEALYAGPTLPAGRHFVEPHLTEHLFVGELPAGYGKINVTATDRFGNVYTAQV